MSGQTRGTRDADGKVTHLDDSILLAYVRRQLPDRSWSAIDLHLTNCSACSQRYTELKESSTTLIDGLRPSPEEPQIEENWDWIENPEAAQLLYQRRQQERLHEDLTFGFAMLTHLPQVFLALLTRLPQMFMILLANRQWTFVAKVMPSLAQVVRYRKAPSYPSEFRAKNPIQTASVLVSLALVLVVAVLLALAAGKNGFFLFQATNNYAPARGQPKVIVPAQSTPTPRVTVPGTGGTATATPRGPKPTISLCLLAADKSHWRMHICGVNFTPGDKVELVIRIANSSPKTLRPVPVDALGKFQDVWSLSGCRSVPVAIYAQDVEHPAIVSQLLLNIQYGGCMSYPNPLPTVVAGHH